MLLAWSAGAQVTSGGGTWNAVALRTAPSPTTSLNVLTRIGPSAAPDGTTTLSCVGVSGAPEWVAVAVYGAKRTFPPTAAVVVVPESLRRFVPVITTVVPADPVHGVNVLMVGEQAPGLALVKSVGLFAVSLALVTWIVPLESPETVAQILVAETTLKAVTGVPPISTLDTSGLSKSVPMISTTHPAGPLVGENDEMVGEVADAGASRPSMSEAAATPAPARRRPRRRFARVMASSSHSASQIQSGPSRGSGSSGALAFVMENGFEWPGLLSALVLAQHPDEHRPERPVLLAVDQQLGEGPCLGVAPELSDPVGPVEVGKHEDVKEFGAGSGTQSVEAFAESAFELIRSHGRRPRPRLQRHSWRGRPEAVLASEGARSLIGKERTLPKEVGKMRRTNPFVAAPLGGVVAILAVVALPGLGVGEPSTSHGLTPSDVFTTTEPEICAVVDTFGIDTNGMLTQVTVSETSNLLVYLSSEWSGLEPGTELLISIAVNDDENNFVVGTPFEWGVSNAPRIHDSGTVMWSFDGVQPGTYDVLFDARTDPVPGPRGGSNPTAAMENCALTVFVNPTA
jgi:hypothetical protein